VVEEMGSRPTRHLARIVPLPLFQKYRVRLEKT